MLPLFFASLILSGAIISKFFLPQRTRFCSECNWKAARASAEEFRLIASATLLQQILYRLR